MLGLGLDLSYKPGVVIEDAGPSPDAGYIFVFDHTGSQVFDHLNQPVAVLQQFNNE